MLTGVAVVASLVVATPGIAQAAWTAAATAKGYAKADSVPQGNTPTTSVNGRDVTVSWPVSRFLNTTPVAGYTVRRFNSSTGVPQTVLASCTGTIAALTCTEFGVAPGTWKYAVTPKQALWTGPESVQSATATVGSPSLTLTTTTLSALPTTSGGSIANFLDGESVIYRLDNATTGTLLAGSITPSPVPVGGSALVNVTVPAGTTLGAHTVYAVGSLGSTASAAITVVDTTPPVVSAAVIAKTAGGTPGYREARRHVLHLCERERRRRDHREPCRLGRHRQRDQHHDGSDRGGARGRLVHGGRRDVRVSEQLDHGDQSADCGCEVVHRRGDRCGGEPLQWCSPVR